MKKTMTINEMILNTLTTKMTKEPKYRKELESLGVEIVPSAGWSSYEYWGIKIDTPENRNYFLTVSKNFLKRKAIFTVGTGICEWDDERRTKIDWFNFIKTHGMRIRSRKLYTNKTHEAMWVLKTARKHEENAESYRLKAEEMRKNMCKEFELAVGYKKRLKELFPNFNVDK